MLVERSFVRIVAFMAVIGLAFHGPARGQTFTKINAAAIVVNAGSSTTPVPAGYTGASWVDADGDGDVDLFVSERGLFRNDGANVFTWMSDAVLSQGLPKGNTWADIDNDGDLDAYVAGGDPSGSALYRNDGGFVFTKVTTGAIGDTLGNPAWSAAFADYDRDGFVDLVLAVANGFVSTGVPNRLFHNDGTGQFVPNDTSSVVQGLAPYTVPTWSDYDFDGDPDLFIGAGPANGTVARDFLYRNRLEVAPAWFQRIDEAPLGTDLQDGQVYNWIDYDNDGDLDVFLTNYAGTSGVGMVNRLYRHDGSAFTLVTTAGAIGTEAQRSLASVWQDFDNDGDLDCFITNDANAPNRLHRNNGDGTFTAVTVANLTVAGPHWGAASGDYDSDGRMDLFVSAPSGLHGLFRNTTAGTNGWLEIRLIGTQSNRAAIGARVRLRSVIGGQPRWQLRELSSQNSFGGMNSLEQHFGLGDAAAADTVLVEWPSGSTSLRLAVAKNQRITITEDAATPVETSPRADVAFGIRTVGPNPTTDGWRVTFALDAGSPATLEAFDLSGRRMASVPLAALGRGTHTVSLGRRIGLPAGVYHLRLTQGARRSIARAVVVR